MTVPQESLQQQSLITTRGQALMMATLYAGHDMPIAELARISHLDRKTVYTRLRSVGIDPNDRQPWHHPHYVGRDPETGEYWHKPFTGDEPEPFLSAEWIDVPEDELQRRGAQWEAMRLQWSLARYIQKMAEPLAEAETRWNQLATALDGMNAAYARVVNAPDGYWTASVSRCVGAQHVARGAADALDSLWDETNTLAVFCNIGRLKEAGIAPTHAWIAAKHGLRVNPDAWLYTEGRGQARRAVDAQIEQQRQHITDVSKLINAGKAGQE